MSGRLQVTTRGPIPEWVRLMAPNALLSAREVARLFGFRSQGSLNSSVRLGTFPRPDRISVGPGNVVGRGGVGDRHRWTKGLIVAEWWRRHESHAMPPPAQGEVIVMHSDRLDSHLRTRRGPRL